MLNELIRGIAILLTYLIPFAALAYVLTRRLHFRREAMRKTVHTIFILTVFVYVNAFDTWYIAACAALGFAIILYPAVTVLERMPSVMRFVGQREDGEIRRSLMIVHAMFAVLISVFWGLLGAAWKYIILVAVLAWGFGDAAAALVGKRWGRHHIRHRWVEGAKTLEGTLAMAGVSFVAILGTLLAYAGLPWYGCVLVALLVAPVSAAVELFSHHGMDTVTVPLATAGAVYAAIRLLF